MRVKEKSKKAGLKLSIKKTKIKASSPITSWQTEGAKVEAVTDFIFLGFKISADGDCSHEIERRLLLGRKANLNSRLKSRDITLPTKVRRVKVMVFPIVLYRCENWTIKKTERWRTDAFELWCWRRLLRIPWTPKRSNQSILKEISPEYSFEGLMLQYFGQLIQRADYWKRPWCWERLKAGGEGDDRGLRWLDSIPDSVDMNLSKLWEMVEDWGAWHAGVQGEAKSWT